MRWTSSDGVGADGADVFSIAVMRLAFVRRCQELGSPPACAEGLGVGVLERLRGVVCTAPPSPTLPHKGGGSERQCPPCDAPIACAAATERATSTPAAPRI